MRSVQATAMDQQAPGAPVSFYFSKDPQSPFENTRILLRLETILKGQSWVLVVLKDLARRMRF